MFIVNLYYDLMYGRIKLAALRSGSKIYTGKTHANCFCQEPKGVLRNAEQGFVTEKDKFVDRKLALKIAKHYNQIKYKHPPLYQLQSEDLF